MKQILAGVITLSLASAAFADVTVNFRNNVLTAANTKVLFGDNNSGFAVGSPVVNTAGGLTLVAQLYHDVGGSLTAVGATANFRPVTQADPLAGTWSGANRTVVGPLAGDTINLVVRAWDSAFASYDAAVAANGLAGTSASFSYKNALSSPPATTDTYMANFSGFSVSQTVGPVIPEPSTIALAGLGVAGLLFLRRK